MLFAYSEAARGLFASALSMSGRGDRGTAALGMADSALFCSRELRLTPAGRLLWGTLDRRTAAVALGSRGRRLVVGLTPACDEQQNKRSAVGQQRQHSFARRCRENDVLYRSGMHVWRALGATLELLTYPGPFPLLPGSGWSRPGCCQCHRRPYKDICTLV